MKNELLATLMLALLLGALVYLGTRQVMLLERMDRQFLEQGAKMSRSQTWRYLDSEGHLQSHTTTTVRGANETKAAFIARFEAEVAADEIIFPPVQQ